jgi:seryl-tRNA synthetase
LTTQSNQRYEEKVREVVQFQSQLELTRGELERQVARMKDRLESNKKSLQHQISELECQLAQSHAATRAAQKDRDEVIIIKYILITK